MKAKRPLSRACGAMIASVALFAAAACEIDRSIDPQSARTITTTQSDASPPASASDAVSCPDCIFGPETFVRGKGAPTDETIGFTAIPGSAYVADLTVIGDGNVIGEVRLNGESLMSLGRSPNEAAVSGDRPVSLVSDNTLSVWLAGRPGSGVRVAIRALTPVAFYGGVTVGATSIQIDGVAGGPYAVFIANYTKWTRSNVAVQGWVTQGQASRAAGGEFISCGATLGDLPPGLCYRLGGLSPSNANAGSGTLVSGTALARIDLEEVLPGLTTVLDSRTIGVFLTSPPPPSVVQVTVVPSSRTMDIGVVTQLSAEVQVTGGAAKTVTWTTSKPQVATVDANGKVTAVSSGDAIITATSTFDPTKQGTATIQVVDFDFAITTPSSAVNVSTGATNPPLNPLSVQLIARSCGPTAVYNNPFRRVDFVVIATGTLVPIGSVDASSATLVDDGAIRCWSYPLVWTPGSGFGTGVQAVSATGYANDLTVKAYSPVNSWITTTNP